MNLPCIRTSPKDWSSDTQKTAGPRHQPCHDPALTPALPPPLPPKQTRTAHSMAQSHRNMFNSMHKEQVCLSTPGRPQPPSPSHRSGSQALREAESTHQDAPPAPSALAHTPWSTEPVGGDVVGDSQPGYSRALGPCFSLPAPACIQEVGFPPPRPSEWPPPLFPFVTRDSQARAFSRCRLDHAQSQANDPQGGGDKGQKFIYPKILQSF